MQIVRALDFTFDFFPFLNPYCIFLSGRFGYGEYYLDTVKNSCTLKLNLCPGDELCLAGLILYNRFILKHRNGRRRWSHQTNLFFLHALFFSAIIYL